MTNNLITIPPRESKAVLISKNQKIKIINTHGTQVVDTWCFNQNDIGEFMSMEHNRAVTSSIFPKEGEYLYTNKRKPILHIMADTSPGRHDTLIAACDTYRYQMLGCDGYHENCTDNLFYSLDKLGYKIKECPSPLNLWMNIPVNKDGDVTFSSPLSKKNDFIILEAIIDCIVVMSVCPMDIVPINGEDRIINEIQYQILID